MYLPSVALSSQACTMCISGELSVTNEGASHKVHVALTNANRQLLWVVPWTSHSALVLSTLAQMITLEVENSSPTTATTLIHLIPTVPRHYLALWVVPLYCSGHWSWWGLHTVHSLTPIDSQRHIRWWAVQASVAIQQDSSRGCSERSQKEQLRQRAGAQLMHVVSLERVQDCSKLPDQQFGHKTPLISRSSFGKTFTFAIRLSLETYHNRRTAKSVVGRQQSLPFRTRCCPLNNKPTLTSFPDELMVASVDVHAEITRSIDVPVNSDAKSSITTIITMECYIIIIIIIFSKLVVYQAASAICNYLPNLNLNTCSSCKEEDHDNSVAFVYSMNIRGILTWRHFSTANRFYLPFIGNV